LLQHTADDDMWSEAGRRSEERGRDFHALKYVGWRNVARSFSRKDVKVIKYKLRSMSILRLAPVHRVRIYVVAKG
jgi:hypothetical protein